MKVNQQKYNWIVDAVLFIGFLVAFSLDLTGLTGHQWLGVFVSLLAGYHLLVHWRWVETVTQRFLKRTSSRSRLYYLVDIALFIGFVLILISGLVVSSWLNLSIDSFSAWVDFHVTVSILTLIVTVIKIGLHWRWIVSTAQRYLFPIKPVRTSNPVAQPALAANRISRREFLSLMGIVSLASLVAMSSALHLEEDAQAGESENLYSFDQEQSASAATGTTLTNTTNSSCSAQCHKGCSYPGHCHRYTDRNNNNLCDLSECA